MLEDSMRKGGNRVRITVTVRTRLESIAERRLRLRQLTKDGNVEISGRDLREASPAAPLSVPTRR